MTSVAVSTETAALEAAPAVASTPGATACASCGAALAGPYCHACGERRREADDFSLRRFLRDAADEVASVDSKTARTLRSLFTRPGHLAAEWVRGRRRPYVGPLRLYLVIYAVELLLARAALPRMGAAGAQTNLGGGWVAALVNEIAARRGVDSTAALHEVLAGTLEATQWFSVLTPLVFACVLALVFARKRRPYGEHLVFATYFAAFGHAANVVLSPSQLLSEAATVVAGLVALVWVGVYLGLSLRRVYSSSRGAAVGLTLVLLVGFILSQSVASLAAFAYSIVVLLYL